MLGADKLALSSLSLVLVAMYSGSMLKGLSLDFGFKTVSWSPVRAPLRQTADATMLVSINQRQGNIKMPKKGIPDVENHTPTVSGRSVDVYG